MKSYRKQLWFNILFVDYVTLVNQGITSSVVRQKLDKFCNDPGESGCAVSSLTRCL